MPRRPSAMEIFMYRATVTAKRYLLCVHRPTARQLARGWRAELRQMPLDVMTQAERREWLRACVAFYRARRPQIIYPDVRWEEFFHASD